MNIIFPSWNERSNKLSDTRPLSKQQNHEHRSIWVLGGGAHTEPWREEEGSYVTFDRLRFCFNQVSICTKLSVMLHIEQTAPMSEEVLFQQAHDPNLVMDKS